MCNSTSRKINDLFHTSAISIKTLSMYLGYPLGFSHSITFPKPCLLPSEKLQELLVRKHNLFKKSTAFYKMWIRIDTMLTQ